MKYFFTVVIAITLFHNSSSQDMQEIPFEVIEGKSIPELHGYLWSAQHCLFLDQSSDSLDFFPLRRKSVYELDLYKWTYLQQSFWVAENAKLDQGVFFDKYSKKLIWQTTETSEPDIKLVRKNIRIKIPGNYSGCTYIFRRTTVIKDRNEHTTETKDYIPHIPYKSPQHCDLFPDELFITNKTQYDSLALKCDSSKAPDFNRYIMMQGSFGGDCHMQLEHQVWLDHKKKEMVWHVTNIWGRCRAGGSKTASFILQKPPRGYELRLEVSKIDYLDELKR